MKILIATIGNIGEWKNVNYLFREKRITARTTLVPLQDIINPDKTLMISMETLIPASSNSYRKHKDNVRSYVLEKMSEWGVRGDVSVVPGVLKTDKISVEADPIDMYPFIYMSIFDELKDHKEIEIHFDITHGINYMIALTTQAIDNIINILSSKERRISLTIYNSEPVIGSPIGDKKIHTIEKSKIIPTYRIKKILPQILRSENLDETLKIKEMTIQMLSEIGINEIGAWISAYNYGMAFPFTVFSREYSKIRNFIEKTIELYENETVIENNSISRRTKFTYNIKNMMNLLPLSSISPEQENIVPIEEIKKIEENIFFAHPMKEIAMKELSEIERRGGKIEEEKYLGEIIKKDWEKSKIGKITKRNMIAHAGMEMNHTLVSKSDGKIKIRYDPKSLDEVIRVLNKF